MKMRNALKTSVLGLLIAFTSCKEEKEAPKEYVRPVEFIEVSYDEGGKERAFSGTARTEKIINLSFRSSGIITVFDTKLGQKVKKGQLLGKLDNVEARLNLERSITSLNSAESQVNTAKLSLDRIRVLYEKGSASLTDFESAKNSFNTAKESYESAKRGVAISREQVNYGFLYAPENGVITYVNAEVDENISPGQNVATLNAGTEMEIAFGLPESIINQVNVGMPVNVTITSLPGNNYKGRVTELSTAIDQNTATYPTRIKLDGKNEDIKTGMAANVTFDLADHKDGSKVLRVPSGAVGEDGSERFVFIIEDEGNGAIVKKSPVKIGSLNSEGFEIVQGLRPGQKIATAGLQTLLDGQRVSVPQ